MIKVLESANEQSYIVEVPIDVDTNFNSSYDEAEDNYEEWFRDDIHDLIDDAGTTLYNNISKKISDNKSTILKAVGASVTYLELIEVEKYDEPMSLQLYITLSKQVDINKLTEVLDHLCNDYATATSEVEFDGKFMGYEHGYNLPDSGGPPIYSSETGEIEVTVTTIDKIKVELE